MDNCQHKVDNTIYNFNFKNYFSEYKSQNIGSFLPVPKSIKLRETTKLSEFRFIIPYSTSEVEYEVE